MTPRQTISPHVDPAYEGWSDQELISALRGLGVGSAPRRPLPPGKHGETATDRLQAELRAKGLWM